MTKLCPRGKAAAKRKFKVYPSAYANAYASKICAGKIKDPSGLKIYLHQRSKKILIQFYTKMQRNLKCLYTNQIILQLILDLKKVNSKKNPGLAKLPTQVRNKMGFMKKGGAVK